MAPEYRITRPRDCCSRASHQHTGDRRRGLQMRSLPSVVDTPSSRGGHNDNNNTSRAASSQRSGRGSQASTSVTLASSPGSLNAASSRSGSTVLSTIEDDNEMGSDDREDLPDMPASNDGQNSRATDTDRDGSLIRRRCFHRLIGDNSDMTIAGDDAHIVFDNYTFNKYTFDDCIFDEHTFEEYTSDRCTFNSCTFDNCSLNRPLHEQRGISEAEHESYQRGLLDETYMENKYFKYVY